MISSKPMKTKILDLYVKPDSQETRVDGLYGSRIKVRIASPPQKGKANKELIEFISSLTGIPKNNIKLISGITSNYKRIRLTVEQDLDYKKIILENGRN